MRAPSSRGRAAVSYGFDINIQRDYPLSQVPHPSLITERPPGGGTSMESTTALTWTSRPSALYLHRGRNEYQYTPTLGATSPARQGTGPNAAPRGADQDSRNTTSPSCAARPSGVTLLKQLKVYAGYGAEKAVFRQHGRRECPGSVESKRKPSFGTSPGAHRERSASVADDDINQGDSTSYGIIMKTAERAPTLHRFLSPGVRHRPAVAPTSSPSKRLRAIVGRCAFKIIMPGRDP